MKSLLSLSCSVSSLVLLSLLAGAPGCSSDDSAKPGGSGSGGSSASGASSAGGTQSNESGTANSAGTAGGSSTNTPVRGSLVVSLNAPEEDREGYSTAIGRFFAGPTPDTFPLKLDTKQGDCELKVPALPFCEEPCTPGVCTANDVCTPYPDPVGVGTLNLSGLGAPLSLMPSTSLVVYQSPSLAYPPCLEGAKVSATSDRFELAANCIAPLELTGDDPLPVKSGEAVHVTWKAAPSAATSRIRIGLDVSHHGGKKGQIDCDVPDTGSYDIPEPLVTKLISLGLAGYPTINVNRVSLGVDSKNADVSLLLSSSITRAVDTGVTSCLENSDCDDGQTCSEVGICK